MALCPLLWRSIVLDLELDLLRCSAYPEGKGEAVKLGLTMTNNVFAKNIARLEGYHIYAH